MTDIVERLRRYPEDDIREAADEIERLRAALRDLLAWNSRNGGYGELPPLIRAAETALEK